MNQPEEIISERIQEEAAKEARENILEEERQKLEEDKRKFEWEKREFYYRKKMEERRFEEETRLFQMKWKILESELQKLAREKQDIAMEKERCHQEFNQHKSYTVPIKDGEAELFFSGVNNELALKKRYKELIKIYHPDNLAGDTVTLQMINRTYDILKKQFTA
ncbi:MAG: molecular chaperone DnaJ [Lachnospiraceae bacterium]|nr:molecular chaperone DnaJ [Lachnospiraceae bacterium]